LVTGSSPVGATKLLRACVETQALSLFWDTYRIPEMGTLKYSRLGK